MAQDGLADVAAHVDPARGGGEFFLAVGTIGLSTRAGRKPSTLLGAARHNRRAIAEHLSWRSCIDSSRSHLNEIMAGPPTPDGIVALADEMAVAAGVVPGRQRKDAVQAVEFIFSLPPTTTLDCNAYFARCLEWVRGKFGDVVLSADAHYDEGAPHLHVLILPLVDGKLRGSTLITRPKLAALWTSFAREVAQPHGLRAPPRRMSPAARAGTAKAVLDRVAVEIPQLVESAVWSLVRRAIEREPAPYAAAFGMQQIADHEERPRMRTMAEIFTGTGRGPKREADQKPIGFVSRKWRPVPQPGRAPEAPAKGGLLARNLCTVGFAIPASLVPASTPAPTVPTGGIPRPRAPPAPVTSSACTAPIET